MGGLFGIGGSAAHTDRKQQLTSWGDLNALFSTEKAAADKQIGEGAAGLTKASNYFSDIASGDPTKMSKALAPQISAIQQTVGQGVNTIGQFSGRSGGSAAAATQEGFAAQQAVQNLFDLLGPEAMKEVAAISGVQEELGTGQQSIALDAAKTTGAQATDARTTDVPVQQAQQAAVMQAIAALAGMA